MQNFLKINDNDNVVVALNAIPRGETITVEVSGKESRITAREEIPAGHKMAVCDIPAGGEVIKYGYRIGNAKEDIPAGAWIHTHNVGTALGDLLEYSYEPVAAVAEAAAAETAAAETAAKERQDAGAGTDSAAQDATFMGFRRTDGQVGVRNEIWVIPTVGCVNNVATAIARQANAPCRRSSRSLIPMAAHRWGMTRSTPAPFWRI